MDGVNLLSIYLEKSGPVTVFILSWLSLYIVLTLWIGVSRYLSLNGWISNERTSLDMLLMGNSDIRSDSAVYSCSKSNNFDVNLLNICKLTSEEKATKGLSTLSMIASTAPFIGLFGTVVSILESFSDLGTKGNASISVIAPVISEALVATAAGIFVAIPAYSVHLFLKRKGYILQSYIQREIDYLLSKSS